MSGAREGVVIVLAALVVSATMLGVVQVADVRRAHDDGGLVATMQAPGDWDGDGYPDDADACPARAETFNGFQDQDGCPDVVARTRAS